MSTAVIEKKKATKFGSLVEDKDIVNILYYGDYGSGKTTALASLARLGKVIYIEAESGLHKKPLEGHGIPIENLQIVRPKDINGPKLKEICDELRSALDDDPNAIAGVVWDSVTEIQAKLLRQTVERRLDRDEMKGKTNDEEYRNELGDYGININEMSTLIRMYRDLPCHVGFSALERRDVDDDGVVTYRPDVTAKLATALGGYMDLVCHTEDQEIDKKHYIVGRFRRTGKYSAKDRFNILPSLLINPSAERVMNYISGDLTAATDQEQQKWLEVKSSTKKEG